VISLSVSASACLSVLYDLENHTAKRSQFLCMSIVAVARSFSGGVAIRYVFPVLWMTSCFHIMGAMAHLTYAYRLTRQRFYIDQVTKEQQLKVTPREPNGTVVVLLQLPEVPEIVFWYLLASAQTAQWRLASRLLLAFG